MVEMKVGITCKAVNPKEVNVEEKVKKLVEGPKKKGKKKK